MKATGIIRRVDELGRIVLPKDIRRSLNLKVGTPLEIYIENKSLILKEYSQINNLKQNALDIVECISKNLECDCFITDNSKVICHCNKCKFNIENCSITSALSNIIEERKTVYFNKTNSSKLKLVSSDMQDYSSVIVCPILVNGDVLGSIVCLSNEKEFSFNECKCVNIVNCLLVKQCELE